MLKSFLFVPTIHLLLYVVIILDIPLLRPIIAFVYLSFIPGFVLFKLLKLKDISSVQKILFIVGLSVVFSMFVGLLLNRVMLSISMPVSVTSLLISLSLFTLILFVIAYRKDLSMDQKNSEECFNTQLNLKNTIIKIVIFLPLIFGIVGSLYSNVYILLMMIISTVALYMLSIFSNKFASTKAFPIILFFISLALILQVVLKSNYIMGYDANLEYYVFKVTVNNEYWTTLSTITHSIAAVNYSSMLSVTILPTVYYYLMNISGELVFKIIYPFIFSLVPVALFSIYSKQFNKTTAILSTLFFISGYLVFYGIESLSLNKQIVGTLFLALSVLIILNKQMPMHKRRFLLVVFGVGLIFSHYSLTLIYLFLIVGIYLLSRKRFYQNDVINSSILSLLSVMFFAWFAYTGSMITTIADSLDRIFSSILSDFGSGSSRFGWLTGPHTAYGSDINCAGTINWVFLIFTHLLIFVGVMGLVFYFLRKTKRWNIDPHYQIISVLSGFILLLCIVVPGLGPSLNFTRFYAFVILFLAPCFVMGGELLVDFVGTFLKKITNKNLLLNTKKITKILLSIVLIGYFLSQSGFINIVTGAVPLSYSLDYDRVSTSTDLNIKIAFSDIYISKQDISSASWLLNHKNTTAEVFADYLSRSHALISYGLIPNNLLFPLSNTTLQTQNSLIYLSSFNTVNNIITTSEYWFDPSEISSLLEISDLLNQSNLVFSNGKSEIYIARSIFGS